MTPIAVSMVQAMAGIFHPFVSLCFQCIFVPGHIASRLNPYINNTKIIIIEVLVRVENSTAEVVVFCFIIMVYDNKSVI